MKDKARALVIALAVGWTPAAAAEIPAIGPFAEGQIRSVDGVGLSDVTVEIVPRLTLYESDLRRFQGQPSPTTVITTVTGTDGSFLIPLPFPAPWSVVARADGFLAMQYPMAFTEDSVSLPPVVLPPAEPIRVEVVDAEGRPVSGARVLARDEDFSGRTGYDLPAWSAVLEDRVTDSDGIALCHRTLGKRLRLRAWTPDRFGVATAEGEARSVRIVVVPGQEKQVVVQADERLRGGILVLLDGIPLTLTSAEGRASMLAPPGDEHPLSFRHPMDWLVPEPIPLPENRHFASLDLRRFPSTSLEARLLDAATGDGIAGAWVWFDTVPLHFVRTDSTGRYATFVVGGEIYFAARSYIPASYRLDEEELMTGRIPDVSLRPASAAIGIAVDASGGPVAAARLTLEPKFRPPGSRRVAARPTTQRPEIRTLSNGRFNFPHLVPNGEYRLIVEKEGFADAELVFTAAPPAPAPPRTLEVVMRPGCTLSGIAVDERGAPVSGAKIQAMSDLGGSRVQILDPNRREVTATATSDTRGRFQLADLSPGKVGLEISADGYFEQFVPVLDLSGCTTRVELGKIVLVAGAEISGQVTDQQGRPLEWVHVCGRAVAPESPKRWAMTSPEGRFSLRGLPLGLPIALRASREDYFMDKAITVEPPFDAQVTLALDRVSDLPQVVGYTLDPQGHPVAGATVYVYGSRIGVDVDGSPALGRSTSTSDAGGRFVLQGVTVESFTAQVSAEGFQAAEVEIEDYRPGSEVVLTLHPAASLEGTVLDAQGRPVADAGISLVAPSGNARTGDDGRYHLSGLPPGPQSIEVKRFWNGHRTAVRDIVLEPGKNFLDFTLEPDSVVSGRVRDEEGRPVVGATVDLHSAGHGGFAYLTAITGDDGTFGIEGVPRGPYSVEIRKEGFPWVRLEDRVRVPTAGAEVSGIEIVLPHGGSIAGAVHGLTDAEISRLSVTAFDQTDAWYIIRAHLEADGSFQIPGLRPGSWTVRAEVDQRSMTDTAVVRSGDETRLDLDFAGGLQLTGQILRSAEPVSDLQLELVSLETGAGFSTSTAEDGRFRFAGLEPGTYRLGYEKQILRRRLELDDHLDLRVDLDALETRVSGSSVDEPGLGR